MRSDKFNRALQVYDGFKGDQTLSHVLSTIPADLCNQLTGKQVGKVMSIRNAAYHEGRSQGLEIIDDCVWIPGDGENGGTLLPTAALKTIKAVTTTKKEVKKTTAPGSTYSFRTLYRDKECSQVIRERLETCDLEEAYYIETTRTTTYTMDFTEQS